jgi:cob(I)alamin adenosyltransferase
LHLYLGDGKGKTSAAVGLAVRAAGGGCPVIFAQFLKSDPTGELVSLEALGIAVLRSQKRLGFTYEMDEQTKLICVGEQRRVLAAAAEAVAQLGAEGRGGDEAASSALTPAASATPGSTASADSAVGDSTASTSADSTTAPLALVVLDEALDALELGFLDEDELRAFIEGVPKGIELVLTGRAAPAWLAELAAYHTEMHKIRHPWDTGTPARRFIEY